MSRKVYIIRGSEDGTVAVVTSAKRALKRAEKYLLQCGPVKEYSTHVAMADLRKYNHMTLDAADGYATCDVEAF